METASQVSAALQRTLYFLPASEGFHRLRSLRITGRAAEHSRAETHALGQLVVADNASVRQLFTYLLSFASGARSFAGLESLFLSSMVNLQARNENLLYRLGIQAWASHEPATKYLSAESLLTILDGENALVTMLPGSSLGFLHQFLIAHGFSSISLGAAIRNPSSVTEVPYDDTWTLNRPGGMFSGESFGRCAAKVTGILTVAGLLGGEGIGAGAGGIIGGIVSGWMCADPPPSDPGLPVSDSPQSPPSDASAPDQEPPDDMSSSDANQGGSGVPPDDPNSAGSGDAGSSGNSSGSDNPQGQEGPDQSLPDGSNQSVGSGGTDGDNGSDPSGSGATTGLATMARLIITSRTRAAQMTAVPSVVELQSWCTSTRRLAFGFNLPLTSANAFSPKVSAFRTRTAREGNSSDMGTA